MNNMNYSKRSMSNIRMIRPIKMFGLLSLGSILIEELEFRFLIIYRRLKKLLRVMEVNIKMEIIRLLLFRNIWKVRCFIIRGSLI
jgi:hypothetical protein